MDTHQSLQEECNIDNIVICQVCKDIFLELDTEPCCICDNCICHDCAKSRVKHLNIALLFSSRNTDEKDLVELYVCSEECEYEFETHK